MDISYILNEFAEDREHYYNAVAPPIIQASNFAFKKVEDFRKAFENEYSTYIYSRGRNPTVEILRKKLAALDGAEDCLVFNSGAAAIFASVLANVKSGDHIVSVDKPYSWAQKMFNNILPRFNVSTRYIDGTQIENFERAILPNTRLIYLESPNSWSYALQDLAAVSELARSENITTICDNSYCSPLYQKPIEFGIDIALQTATKYINGHSDTLGGVICGRNGMIQRIFHSEYMTIGSGIQPFNAWLLIRGLRTLQIRLDRVNQSTNQIVNFLKNHPKVEQIIFPFDESFPQYDLAKKQMKGACGLISFIVKADNIDQLEKFCENLQHILMAVSWGGHESLIIPGCASINRSDFNSNNKDHRTMRLYVGLEDPEYIIKDLERGFEMLGN